MIATAKCTSCGASRGVVLKEDIPAAGVLAELACTSCGRRGARLHVEPFRRSAPAPDLPPDKEGDEELLEQRGRMRTGWREW